MRGFVRIGAAVPKLRVADVSYNIEQIIELAKEADEKDVAMVVFPELCITGYTCADLFFQKRLSDDVEKGLVRLAEETRDMDTLVIVGASIMWSDDLYNCAVVIHRGRVMGIQPKIFLPNYNEFYEKRWFSSGKNFINKVEYIDINKEKVPFGGGIYTSKELGYKMGIEICEDLWAPIPPSSQRALQGANIIVNLSASNEVIGKNEYRCSLISGQSSRCIAAYVYSSAGVHESTTDLVFGGYAGIYENGKMLAENDRFGRENELIITDIDVDVLISDRVVNKTFADSKELLKSEEINIIEIEHKKDYAINKDNLLRYYSITPFVPSQNSDVDKRCKEIFSIQVAGLAKRLEHTGCKKVVLGLSGGSDSTLALLVCKQAFEILKMDSKGILAITMPGFGTSKRTHKNALKLADEIGITLKEIDIKHACLKHFEDIGHDASLRDVTYENVQARERTQILMDIANKENALVIGTGDLSELALGWCTYNADHMSMYAVNCSIPKTLVKYLIKWYAISIGAKAVLFDILDTPISPELLPPDEQGKINQQTETILGPYEVHDFYLYYFVRFKMTEEKMLMLASIAFDGIYNKDELEQWLKIFIERFFKNQFKRSCMPDGPKVGSICLSPRGDWRMPSDATIRRFEY
ncbi:MAG: NAD(+) synthase [Clostridiales bacterium GWE2_32_10]|nr:MAG: NAD(+) synthase [Clostridiales bacterium GWE2_32_10]HBY19884.1 NAD(+) synthase [Clostridiales bacterium]